MTSQARMRRSQDRRERAIRVMNAERWSPGLDRDVAVLRTGALARDAIGWGGVFASILGVMVLALVVGTERLQPTEWVVLTVVVSAPFAGLCLGGVWSNAWLRSIEGRRRGVTAARARRNAFLLLTANPLRAATLIACAWIALGLVAATYVWMVS